ncbi:hypothetical protein Tco_1210940 [Tanacetum coccineum]
MEGPSLENIKIGASVSLSFNVCDKLGMQSSGKDEWSISQGDGSLVDILRNPELNRRYKTGHDEKKLLISFDGGGMSVWANPGTVGDGDSFTDLKLSSDLWEISFLGLGGGSGGSTIQDGF